jgi:hypothetical protein
VAYAVYIAQIWSDCNTHFLWKGSFFAENVGYNHRMAKKSDKSGDNVIPLRKMGRPPFQWTPELEDFVISCILANKSMREIEILGIEEFGKGAFPSSMTIKNYLASNDEFFARYTRAKDLSQDFMAEDLIDIIDGRHPDFVNEDLAQRKESMEARKWVMGKLRRKKWGEVKTTELTGADGAPLLQPQVLNTRQMDPETRAALYNALQLAVAQQEAEDAEYTEVDENDV